MGLMIGDSRQIGLGVATPRSPVMLCFFPAEICLTCPTVYYSSCWVQVGRLWPSEPPRTFYRPRSPKLTKTRRVGAAGPSRLATRSYSLLTRVSPMNEGPLLTK